MKYVKLLSLVFLLLPFGIVSCSNTVNTVEPEEDRSNPTTIEEKKIITDSSLSDIANVVDVRETTVANGLLKVQVKLKNLDTEQRRVNYRFVWLDEDGMKVRSSLSAWRPKVLEAKETVWISAVAPQPNVNSFQFKMQEPKN